MGTEMRIVTNPTRLAGWIHERDPGGDFGFLIG